MPTVPEGSLAIPDILPEGYACFDSEFRFTFINQVAEPLFRTARGELLGKSLWDIYPEIAGSELEHGCRRAMTARVVVTIDHYYELARRFYQITVVPEPGGGIVVRFLDVTGRKLVEDALRKSEEKFSKAFHSNPAPMCILDTGRNGGFLAVNEAFARITGYRSDELIGYTSTAAGLYDDLCDREESKIPLLRGGGYRNVEKRFRKKNGEILIGLVSAEPIELNGSLCAIAVAVDITGQRRADQALRDSEEQHRRLFEVVSDAILLVDHESGKILEANPAAIRLYGYIREELLSMNWIDLPAEPDETVRTTTGMETFIPLRRHRKKDGTVFPVEISACYFDLKGRAVFMSAIRDVTSRCVMEEALKKSEEKFSKAFHSNPAAITISDLTTGAYLDVNDAFEEMTGYRRQEVVGRSGAEIGLVDPGHRNEKVTKLVKEGRLRNWEFRFRRKTGEVFVGLASADLVEIDGKTCVVSASIDFTEREKLEMRLRQAQKLESLGRLAGGVAHDFNNLLTVINGYSDMVVRALNPGDPLYPQAQEIQKAGDRAASLTNQLLMFSRQKVIEPRPLDVNSAINDAKKMLRRLIGEDIELSTTLDPQVGRILADPGQIHQVIMNLAINARDAMPDGGRLEIAATNADISANPAGAHSDPIPGSYVLISVTDNGIGMDEKTLQNAFEPFFTTKEYGKGTGLGLATVYGIVRQSGGWIQVSSEPGRGSSFRIYLPRVDACPVPEAAAPVAAKTLRGCETVLVVEDQEEVRGLTVTVLKDHGYHVLEAANGAEALSVAGNHAGGIHLLLTDVVMSGMNGKDLSERLRALRPGIKVLFTSGYAADVIARRGVLEDNVAYLPKPFTPERLAAKVREVLTGQFGSESRQEERIQLA